MATPTVLLRQLGVVGYCRALALQKSLASQYREEQPQGKVSLQLLSAFCLAHNCFKLKNKSDTTFDVCLTRAHVDIHATPSCTVAVPQVHVGELLACEHDPVYTFGLRQSSQQAEAAKLRLLGCEVHQVG
jgi:hypothetical protein